MKAIVQELDGFDAEAVNRQIEAKWRYNVRFWPVEGGWYYWNDAVFSVEIV